MSVMPDNQLATGPPLLALFLPVAGARDACAFERRPGGDGHRIPANGSLSI
jgi:hypothetical protein